MQLDKIISAIIAILLLFCLLPMPYGYYNLVRLVATVSFVWLAYNCYEEEQKNEIFIYVVLAFLFQPFVKIHFGRTIWNLVDVVVSAILIIKLLRK